MIETSDLRELLLTYKLGKLSSDDREKLDAQMVGDQEFSDRLADAEYDLLDDYRAGRLSRVQCRRVEKAFSPQELSRGRAPASAESAKPLRAALPARLRFARMGAVAASILAIAAGLMMMYLHKPQSRPQLAKTQIPSPSVAVPAPSSQTAPALPGEGSKSPLQTSRAVAVLLLEPAIARGTAGSVLHLPLSVHAVRVQWIVPAGVAQPSFSLSVTKAGSVLTKANQHGGVQNANGSQVVEFDLDAAIFAQYPANARFLFVIYAGGTSRAAQGEYPVVIHKE